MTSSCGALFPLLGNSKNAATAKPKEEKLCQNCPFFRPLDIDMPVSDITDILIKVALFS